MTLSSQTRIDPTHVREILYRLALLDLLILDASGETVLAAYPFSATVTPHRVRLNDREVFALCAVDALGIPLMLQEKASISSLCGHCGVPIEAQARPEKVTRYVPSETLVWFPTSANKSGPVAKSRCPSIRFFCASDHLELWRHANGQPPGLVLSFLEAFEAGREIFGSLLAEPNARPPRRTSCRKR